MLAFHGFAMSSKDFYYFKSLYDGLFEVTAPNHFFHEQAVYPSSRKHQQPLSKKELAEFYMNLLEIKNSEKITLMGYSMGGKIALLLLEYFPEKIERVFLMAPDGLYMNPWYKLIVFTSLGRKLMRKTLNNPEIYFRLSTLAYKLGLINEKLYHFFDENMKSKEARLQVYDTWLGYRKIIPDLKKVVSHINDNKIPVHLLIGEFDSIITTKIGNKFQVKSDYIQMHDLPCGHMMNNEKVKEVFEKLF